jgi:hypothetical protein
MNQRLEQFGNDIACLVITIEHAFGENQCDVLFKELMGIKDVPNRYGTLASSLIQSIKPNYSGSFAIIFDELIMSLSEQDKNKIIGEVVNFLTATNFMNQVGFIKAVENEPENIVSENDSGIIQRYLDALSECCYSIEKNYLHELFNGHFSAELIDKVIVLNLMKNPKLFLS